MSLALEAVNKAGGTEDISLQMAVLETEPTAQVVIALIGQDWLRSNKAVVDVVAASMFLKNKKVHLKLKRARNGHLLLPLRARKIN